MLGVGGVARLAPSPPPVASSASARAPTEVDGGADAPGARQALEKYNIEKDIATHIKKEFDKKYGPTWHCIVGRNFGEPPNSPRRRMRAPGDLA
jgi:hypothetical protein